MCSSDLASATFAVRPTGANDYQVVRNVLTTDAGLRASGGTVGIVAGDWASPLPEPTGTPAKQAYDLRVTLADAAGNVTTILGTFVLQPGVPSVTLSRAGSGVLGTLDISQEAPPEFTVDATATGGGVTIANLTATLRSRATGAITAIPITRNAPASARESIMRRPRNAVVTTIAESAPPTASASTWQPAHAARRRARPSRAHDRQSSPVGASTTA